MLDVDLRALRCCGGAYNYRDVKNHVGDVGSFSRPKRIDQLRQRAAERIRQASDSCRTHSSFLTEPDIRVSGRSAQNEWLSQSNEDLSKHHSSKIPTSRTSISNPIAD